MDIDESKIGFSRDSEEFRVNTARLAQFAGVLGIAVGPMAEGRIAHPIFAHIPATQSMMQALRAALPGFGFHGEHDFHYHKPIAPGQRLFTLSVLQELRQTKAGAALIVRSDLRTHDGELLNVQYTTIVVPDTALSADAGERAPRPPDTAATGSGAPVETGIAIADDLARRYSEASRDYSPYTMRKDAAQKLGLSDPILHGMCTLGLAAGPILERAAGGDASRLKRFGCRFTHPLYLTGGRSISIRHWHGTGPEGPLVAFEIGDDAGNSIVRNGFAEFGQ